MEGPVQAVPFPQPVILCLIWACLSVLLCSCTFFDTKVNRSYFLCDVQDAHLPVLQVSAALEGRTSSLSSLPAVLGAPLHARPSPCVRAILAPSVVKKLTSTKKPELNN